MSKPCLYADYLQLAPLLASQQPRTRTQTGEAPKHELFFIITHQVFELWFKQMLAEMDSVLARFADPEQLHGEVLLQVEMSLSRSNAILKHLTDQFALIEQLTPHQFLAFREALTPASGFQSLQFRALELKLGVQHDVEKRFANFPAEDLTTLVALAKRPNLHDRVELWLSTLYQSDKTLQNAIAAYQTQVTHYLAKRKPASMSANAQAPQDSVAQIAQRQWTALQTQFTTLFDSAAYEAEHQQQPYAFSQAAMLGGLAIYLSPLNPQHRLLSQLVEMDEQWAHWRYRHALMVERMIGSKVGTGGSSGFEYLLRTTQSTRVFHALGQISTFLLPV